MQSVQDPIYLAALERRFAAASRHSRMVGFFRKAVPATLVLAMAAFVAVSLFNPFRMLTQLPLNMSNIVVSGTKITMQSPQMSGFTPDRRAYELSARSAAQDISNPNQVELEVLKAKIEMQDKSIILMDAQKGYFRSREQLLDLYEKVVLMSPTYEVRLSEAQIDMAKGSVISNKPVEVRMLEGKLDAQRLEIFNRGELLTFDGGVTMTLTPRTSAAPAEQTQ